MAEAYIGRYRADPERGPFVIKRIRPDYASSEEHRRRFELEAQVASRLRHRNLVRFHEYGRVGDCHYIVMSMVRGHSLHRLLHPILDGAPPPPLAVALSLGLDIAEGLAEMHSATDEAGRPRPMLHRDATPKNVIVSHRGRAVLIDFGIAKDLMGPNITLPGQVIGTTRYMAPEHRLSEVLDPRADVFSAGVILFEVLTGRKPWPSLTQAQELLRVRFDPPEWTEEERRRIPRAVRAVVQAAVACEAKDRFADAKALSAALFDCAVALDLGEEGPAAVRAWVASLGMELDERLSSPVVDVAASESDETVVMWNSTGGLNENAPSGIGDDGALAVPPLPPAREAAVGPEDWDHVAPPRRLRPRTAVLLLTAAFSLTALLFVYFTG